MRILQGFNSTKDIVFATNLIHWGGSIKTVLGETKKDSIKAVEKLCEKYPNDYIASVVPYSVFLKQKIKGIDNYGVYDVSIPAAIKKSIGMELRIYLSEGRIVDR